MGTNYYLRMRPCRPDCKDCAQFPEIHLGKSSAGWRFTHRADPLWPRAQAHSMWLHTIRTMTDMGLQIEDECGVRHEVDELLRLIESKQKLRSHSDPHPEEEAAWRARGEGQLWDSLRSSDFVCDGYDFLDREFN